MRPPVEGLHGGFVIRCRRCPGPPLVSVRAWLPAGARTTEHPGLALITGRLLAEGSLRRSWKELARSAEDRGAALWSSGGYEISGVAVDALAGDWRWALETVAEVMLEPAFPASRCQWLVRQAEAELVSLSDRPDVRTGWAFLRQLYDPHPRSLPLQGNASALARVTPEACRSLYRRGLAAGGLVTIAGAVDEEAATLLAEELFGGGRTAEPRPDEAPRPEGLEVRRRIVDLSPGDQDQLFLGHLTVRRNDADHPALGVAAAILGSGAGLHGRITGRIREREGLAYDVACDTTAGAGLDAGRLVVYLASSGDGLRRSERIVREELARFLEEGPTAAEVDEARSYLLGREAFERETARQWADLLAESELYGVPLERDDWLRERLASLDRQAVRDAIRKHLSVEELRVTVGRATSGGAG